MQVRRGTSNVKTMKFLLLKIFILIWTAELQRNREREKTSIGWFTPQMDTMGHFWANLKPGARSVLWVIHMDASAHALGPSSTVFQGAVTRIWIRKETAWTQTIWECQQTMWSLNLLCHIAGPRPHKKFLKIWWKTLSFTRYLYQSLH